MVDQCLSSGLTVKWLIYGLMMVNCGLLMVNLWLSNG